MKIEEEMQMYCYSLISRLCVQKTQCGYVIKMATKVVHNFSPPHKKNHQLSIDKTPLKKKNPITQEWDQSTPYPETKKNHSRRVRGVATLTAASFPQACTVPQLEGSPGPTVLTEGKRKSKVDIKHCRTLPGRPTQVSLHRDTEGVCGNHEEIENLNRLIKSKEIESGIKNSQQRKAQARSKNN